MRATKMRMTMEALAADALGEGLLADAESAAALAADTLGAGLLAEAASDKALEAAAAARAAAAHEAPAALRLLLRHLARAPRVRGRAEGRV